MAEQANATSKPKDTKPFDAMDPWRGMRDAYLETWAKTMVDMVNSEAYARTSGAMLDAFLTTSAPFRELLEKTMVRTLKQLSMPTRADITTLAGRITNIEMRLDDMDAKLDRLLEQKAAEARPAREPRKEPK